MYTFFVTYEFLDSIHTLHTDTYASSRGCVYRFKNKPSDVDLSRGL